MNKLKLVSAALSCSLLLCSCGQNASVSLLRNSKTQISFSWWGNDSRHIYTLPAIETFEDIFPDINVRNSYSEWSGYQKKYNAQMVSKSETDVMQINYSWLSEYSPDGSGYYDLSTLGDYIDFSNYSEDDLSYGTVNGVLNAVPIALNTQTVYVNKTIYDSYGLDVPETFDDLFRAAEVMNGENYPVALSKKPAWFFIVAWAGQKTGKDFMDSSGRILYGREEISMMIDFYCELVNKKVMPLADDFDKRDISSGKYASTIVWLSDANNYCKGAQDNGYEMVIGNYFTLNGKLRSWFVKPATLYAISANTRHPEESAKLLNYLVNSEEMAEFQKTEKGIPLSSTARNYLIENNELDDIQTDAYNKMTENQSSLELISPYFETSEVYEAFMASCTEVYFGKSDSKEQAELLLEVFRTYRDSK